VRGLLLAALLLAPSVARADDGWELRIDERIDVEAGAAAAVSLTIAGTGGRTISKDGPVRVSVSSSTIELKRTRYDRRNAADPAADAPRFDLKLVAKEGDHELAIEARFWLCGKRTCRPVRARRTVAVHAAPPPVAP
jgi:hypothetical protein